MHAQSPLTRSKSAPSCIPERRGSPLPDPGPQPLAAVDAKNDGSLDTRGDFEASLAKLLAFADVCTGDDACSQWLVLLRFAVFKGGQEDLQTVLKVAAVSLPKRLAMRWLLAVLEHVPDAYQHLSPEAARQLLRQCLLWAVPHAQDDYRALLERFRQLCVHLPAPVESGLKWMLLELLGVGHGAVSPHEEMRLALAFGSDLPSQGVATVSTGGGVPRPENAFRFLNLPLELQQLILRWVLPDLASVRRQGKDLSSVCKAVTTLVVPTLQPFKETLPHHWRDASRLQASPQEAARGWVAAMARCFFGPLRQHRRSRGNDVESSSWDALVNAMHREARRMAWAVCQLPDTEAGNAVMAELFDQLRDGDEGDIYLHDLPQSLALMICLQGTDTTRFGAMLATLLRCTDKWTVDEQFFNGLWLHVGAFAPPDIRGDFERRMKAYFPVEEPPGFWYVQMLDVISPAYSFTYLRGLRPRLGGAISLSWLQLIGMTHRVSESRGWGLVELSAWWEYAQTQVQLFLLQLHDALPSDAPLPFDIVCRHIPQKLLRAAFQDMRRPFRQAMLQRPAVRVSGQCLQLPLLCDYCLDGAIDPDSRMALLRWWETHEPEAVHELKPLALQWTVPPKGATRGCASQRVAGRDGFRRRLGEVESRLNEAMWSDAQLWLRLIELLPLATDAEDIGLVLALAERQLPKPIHQSFWREALDWMPLICRNDTAALLPALRICLAAVRGFSEDDQLGLLMRFCEASVFLELPTALWAFLVLRLESGAAGFSSAVRERLHEGQLDLLDRYFQETFVPEGWALVQDVLMSFAATDETSSAMGTFIEVALIEARDRAQPRVSDDTDSD